MPTIEELEDQLQAAKLEVEEQQALREELAAQREEDQKLFEDVGGPEAARETINYILADPAFEDYLQSKKAPPPPQDQNEQEAIEKVKQLAKDAVLPVEKQVAQLRISNVIETLTEKYPGWEQYSEEIQKLQDNFPFQDTMNPTKEEFEALFLMAARRKDGDAGIEILINEPIADPQEEEQKIPSNISGEQALELARQHIEQGA